MSESKEKVSTQKAGAAPAVNKELEKDPNYAKFLAQQEFMGGFDASEHTPEDVCKKMGVDPQIGLTEAQAQANIQKYGPNKLIEAKKESVFQMFMSEFKDPLVLILLVAALIDMVFAIINTVGGVGDAEDWAEMGVILAIVLIDAVIGTVQEAKAAKSLEALKSMSSPSCTVRRDGKLKNIKSEQVALGDVVILEEGAVVPADIRLTTSVDMKSDEASLTGESVPSEKNVSALLKPGHAVGDEANIAHSSCPISYGRGEGVVVGTGMNTQIGKIANMLQEEDDETPLQKKLAKLGTTLCIICVVIVAAMFIVGLLWLIPEFIQGTFDGEDIKQLFMAAIALAVAAIPEGLPAVVTIVLAMGMSRMVRVNTIVRKLPSVETLGSVTVVCSDKTGTLTQNRMTIKKVYAFDQTFDADSSKLDNPELELIAKGMMLDSNASIDGDRYGDPTELALLDYAHKFGIDKEATQKDFLPRIDEMPFDSVRKMMSTMHVVKPAEANATVARYAYASPAGDKTIIFTKGALDSILAHTTDILDHGQVRPITKEDIDKINAASKALAKQAYRVLAFAIHGGEHINEEKLTYVGMVAMIDPPRLEAKPAVAKFHQAGITTIMITGDHADTALAIGKDLGIASKESETMTGAQIDQASEAELQEDVKHVRIFARVSPQNKVQIVKALKANGEIVAMTGDGVNDAPSLKAADVGIAMGITGTDVAKGAADMVLADDNFASIEKAVEEGRSMFSNIKKTIFYLLSSNFAEILVMFLATCANIIQPLSAMQLLWINLITDSFPAIALGRDDKDPDVMLQKPRNPKDGVFAHGGFAFCVFYGFVIFVLVFSAFLIPVLIGITSKQYWTSTLGQPLVYENDLSWVQLMNAEDLKTALMKLNPGLSWDQISLALEQSGNGIVTSGLDANKFGEYLNASGALQSNEAAAAVMIFEDGRTMAFTTLSMAELFHMIGMSNLKQSFFKVFKGKNWFFIVAFVFGLVMQVVVTEVPGLTNLFTGHSRGLAPEYWGYCLALSLVVLVVHEAAIPAFKNKAII